MARTRTLEAAEDFPSLGRTLAAGTVVTYDDDGIVTDVTDPKPRKKTPSDDAPDAATQEQ